MDIGAHSRLLSYRLHGKANHDGLKDTSVGGTSCFYALGDENKKGSFVPLQGFQANTNLAKIPQASNGQALTIACVNLANSGPKGQNEELILLTLKLVT